MQESGVVVDVPDWVTVLPAVNAGLNSLATVLLVTGYAQIRRGRRKVHQRLMLSAFATSVAFLACYLVYHTALKSYTGESGKPFTGVGAIRAMYYAILVTHVSLAGFVPILAWLTIRRAFRGQWEAHKRIARVTFPIWLYVSVTGVMIYVMLYHLPM